MSKPMPPAKSHHGNWIQTERKAHEEWAKLIGRAPKAAQLMHIITARIGEYNAVVISQKTLTELMGASRRTVQRALMTLADERWIEVRQIGENGTVNAYVINDRVAWTGKRDGIRYSLFTANIVISSSEQPDREAVENDRLEPLRHIPSLFRDEEQLPTGAGLPPVSQPAFPGMEHALPARRRGDAPDLDSE